MEPTPRYALYTRISKDPTGTSTAPARQEKDCRRLARERGLKIIDVYTDTDTSAYRDVIRPQYEAMLAAMADGAYDGVIVWKLDRLVRRIVEFSRFWKVASEHGVDLISRNDPVDTTSPIGVGIVHLIVALAEQESYNTSLRLRAKEREMAEAGVHKGAGRRAYGMAAGWQEIIPEESAVINDLAERLLAGASIGSLVRDLNHRAVPSATGGTWNRRSLVVLMRSARLWGWREHNGEIVAQGTWPSILDEVTGRKVRQLLDSRRGIPQAAHRRYLLSGLLTCEKCGAPMKAASGVDGKRRYTCPPSDSGGCAGTTILMEPTDTAVAEIVQHRLRSANVIAMLRARNTRPTDDAALLAELAELGQRTDELGKAYAAGDLPIAAFTAAQRQLDERTQNLNGQLATVRRAEPVVAMLDSKGGVHQAWEAMTPDRRRVVLDALLERIVVHGAGSEWYRDRLRGALLEEADEAEAAGDRRLAQRRRRQAASRNAGGGSYRPERLEPIWRT